MKSFARLFLVIVCLALCLSTPSVAAARWVPITILHTNDLHGAVMPRDGNGGLVRAATLIREIRAEMPNVLLLDGGDIIHGTLEDYLSGHVATVSAMNAAGYDLAATGNHEYDFGLPTLQRVERTASFPFVAANIRSASGGDWDLIGRYKVLNVDGVRVGVVGLATLETISLHWPGAIKDIKVEDPIETAKAIVPEVATQSDVVVVLSHLGVQQDRVLAQQVPGIDFIVGGHSHTAVANWEWLGNTLVAQAAPNGRALGRIDFIVRKGEGKGEIWSVNGQRRKWNDLPHRPLWRTYPEAPLLPVGSNLPEDAAVRRAYLPYRVAADARLRQVVGRAAANIPGRALGADESPAGDLVADAVRSRAKSDIGVIDANGLGDRGLPAGPVTTTQISDLIGGYTRQEIVVIRVTGSEIIAAFNAGFARKKAINIAISGAAIECEMADGAPRVESLMVGGKPVDPDGSYTVAAQAYVIMSMMESAPGASVVAELGTTTREALADYFRTRRTVHPPEPGRIKRGE